MAVALASRSAPASRRRNEDAQARIHKAHQDLILAAAVPRLTRAISKLFVRLRDSAVHGSTKELKGNLPISYSQPHYSEFEDALTKLLTKEYINLGEQSFKGVQVQLGVAIDFDLNERIIPKGLIARKVTGVSQETQHTINKIIRDGIDAGSHPSVIAKNMRDTMTQWAELTKSRAYTIARTETAVAYNFGSLIGYQKSGLVRQVRVLDGAGCGWLSHNDPDTAQGKVVDLQNAFNHTTSHPNCVRAFAPVAAGLEEGLPEEPAGDLYANPKNFHDTTGPTRLPYGVGDAPLEKWADQIYMNADGVTEEMKVALAGYSGSQYRWMNQHLRGLLAGSGEELPSYGAARLQALQSYLAKGVTPDAVVVHRGAGSGRALGLPARYGVSATQFNQAALDLVGQTFTEDGFMSTALHENAAFGGVRLELTVPKGYNAMPVSARSMGGTHLTMSEAELVLAPGARYVIEEVSGMGSGSYVTLKGRILP